MSFINETDITFVVQGPVLVNITKKACQSIRNYFPKSKIILSTWIGSDVGNIDYDSLVLSRDPKAKIKYYTDRDVLNNLNRMIISSFNGLKKVKSKYSVKMRSDIFYESNNLIKLLTNIKKKQDIYTLHKIIIPSNLTVNPYRTIKMPLHPSDFFFAGLTKDLVSLFNINLMNTTEMEWFLNNHKPKGSSYPTLIPRFSNEQFLFYSFLKSKIKIKFDNAFDANDEVLRVHNATFEKIFLLYHSKKIGFNCNKYPISYFTSINHAYTEYEFKNLNLHKFIYLDFERFFSYIICLIKIVIKKLSKNFYYLIKRIIDKEKF